ncbi:hypothetical protein ACWDFL_08580 [Streptomyces bungoensis]
MTAKDTGTHAIPTAVLVRGADDVDEESLAYVREKVGAVLGRPGVPAVGGEVRVSRAAAHHDGLPWSARAELVVAGATVVVRAEEATAHELADRLYDRLRARMDRTLHRGDQARRASAAPPWRGGRAARERG